MENIINGRNYESAKEKARKYCGTAGNVWCKALKDSVAFSDAGFRHLLRRPKGPRPKNEQMHRFILLTHAADIIKNADRHIAYRVKKETSKAKWRGAKTKNVSHAQFWELTREIEGRHISVIVRQIGNGKKQFLSIFEKTNKKRPTK